MEPLRGSVRSLWRGEVEEEGEHLLPGATGAKRDLSASEEGPRVDGAGPGRRSSQGSVDSIHPPA